MVKVGTASWTDPTLIRSKRFYPVGCSSAEARLRFYATQFPLVEVDSSYYAMPNASNAVLWAERTPADFTFNIKAFRFFTGHQIDRAMFPKDMQSALPQNGKRNLYYRQVPGDVLQELWRRYLEAIDPLRTAGKLGAVHFQFAAWMINNAEGRRHVEHCADVMEGYTVAVAFRHESWFADAGRTAGTLALERERRLRTLVNIRKLTMVKKPLSNSSSTSSSQPMKVWRSTSSERHSV